MLLLLPQNISRSSKCESFPLPPDRLRVSTSGIHADAKSANKYRVVVLVQYHLPASIHHDHLGSILVDLAMDYLQPCLAAVSKRQWLMLRHCLEQRTRLYDSLTSWLRQHVWNSILTMYLSTLGDRVCFMTYGWSLSSTQFRLHQKSYITIHDGCIFKWNRTMDLGQSVKRYWHWASTLIMLYLDRYDSQISKVCGS